MFSSLAKLLQSVQTGALKNILTGAGVMLGTAGVSMAAFNHAVDKFRNMSASFTADLLALMNLSGMDLFLAQSLGPLQHTSRYSPANYFYKNSSEDGRWRDN